jgi:hypothetical protein
VADSERVARLLLQIATDEGSQGRAISGIDLTSEALAKLSSATTAASNQARALNEVLSNQTAVDVLSEAYGNLTSKVKEVDAASKSLNESFQNTFRSYSEGKASVQDYLEGLEQSLEFEEKLREAREQSLEAATSSAERRVQSVYDEIQAEQEFMNVLKQERTLLDEMNVAPEGYGTNQMARGYGVSGGMVGPAQPSSEDMLGAAQDRYSQAQARLKSYLEDVEREISLEEQVNDLQVRGATQQSENAQRRIQAITREIEAEQELANVIRDLQTEQEQANGNEEFEAAQQRVKSVYSEVEAEQELTDKLKEQQAVRASLQAEQESGYSINEMARGYGVQGGMIGPGLPPEEGEEGGGGSIGGAFGVGHALSVAGHATGSPALREAGAAIYIEEGARQTAKLFGELNDKLLETGGLIPALTETFVALDVPLAGLAATVAPIVIGVAAVGAVFLALKSQLDEGKDAVEQAITRLDKFYAAIGGGKTSDELQSDLDKAKTKLANDQAQFKQVSDQMLSGIGQATEGQGIGAIPGMVKLLLSGGFQELEGSADKLKAALKDDQANVDSLTDAMGSQDTAYADYLKRVHDAVEASKAQAEEETKIADLRESGTAKQVQAEMDRIDHQVEANHRQLEILNKMDQTNPDVIKAEGQIIDDNAELSLSYAELSGDILDAAKARDAEADAIKEQLKQMKTVEKAEIDYNQAKQKTVDDLAAHDAAAKEKEKTAEEQYTKGSIQDAYQRTQIALDESRKEVEIKQQTFDQYPGSGNQGDAEGI